MPARSSLHGQRVTKRIYWLEHMFFLYNIFVIKRKQAFPSISQAKNHLNSLAPRISPPLSSHTSSTGLSATLRSPSLVMHPLVYPTWFIQTTIQPPPPHTHIVLLAATVTLPHTMADDCFSYAATASSNSFVIKCLQGRMSLVKDTCRVPATVWLVKQGQLTFLFPSGVLTTKTRKSSIYILRNLMLKCKPGWDQAFTYYLLLKLVSSSMSSEASHIVYSGKATK